MSTPKLLSALAEAGQPYDGELTFNTFIRYGKRQTDTYHWLVIHPVGGNHLAAYFGDWRKGSSQAFKSWENGVRLEAEKAGALERELEQRRRAQELADQRRHQQAAAQMSTIRRATGAATQRYRRSFLFGFANRVGELLDEARSDAEAGVEMGPDGEAASVALVLRQRADRVGEHARNSFGRVRSARRPAAAQADAWHDGSAAAEQADIGRSRLAGRAEIGP